MRPAAPVSVSTSMIISTMAQAISTPSACLAPSTSPDLRVCSVLRPPFITKLAATSADRQHGHDAPHAERRGAQPEGKPEYVAQRHRRDTCRQGHQRVVIRVGAGGKVAEGDQVVGRPFQLAA